MKNNNLKRIRTTLIYLFFFPIFILVQIVIPIRAMIVFLINKDSFKQCYSKQSKMYRGLIIPIGIIAYMFLFMTYLTSLY